MSDNLANLRNYKIQLRQVEMSLKTDPDNEDLKKLHEDLNVGNNLIVVKLIFLTFFVFFFLHPGGN